MDPNHRNGPGEPLTVIREGTFNGDPDAERCNQFRSRHSNVQLVRLDPLYVLPSELIGEISKVLPDWLSESERNFERDLANLCESLGAVGIAENGFVRCSLLKPSPIPPELIKKLSTQFVAEAPKDTANKLTIADERLELFHGQMQAFAGWLLTNPEFLDDRNSLRRRMQNRNLRQSFSAFFIGSDQGFKQFLDKWMLTGLSSWELPIPQGPNLSGVSWPDEVSRRQGMVNVSMPNTMSMDSRFPLRDVIAEMHVGNRPGHLTEWFKVLDRKGKSKGMQWYQRTLHLHFYLNFALGARYGDRLFARNWAKLDSAFGSFFCVGDDLIRQIRQEINRRPKRSEDP
jgi:hypothetical protein